jgi:predicted transcriptional regulator
MASKRRQSTRPDPGGPFFLARWMDALGVTDRQLCELLDVSQPAVSRWRSGSRVPRRYATEDGVRDPIVTIAKALTKLSGTKVQPSDLWTSPKPGRQFNSHPMIRKDPK